ncbi:MAG TPA: ascorbate-dependent monooxygenase [Thermoanaerobaculia bacterium]
MAPSPFRRFLPALAALLALAAAGLLAQTRVPPREGRPRIVPARPEIAPQGVTFSREVSRILQDNCQSCHRTGGIAPFALTNFAEAREHALQIAVMTSSRVMPPWHAGPNCASYEGDPTLAPEEIEALTQWAVSGTPEGDPRELPPPREFPDGWRLGTPGQVLTMPEPYTPDFSQGDDYRCFVLPTGGSTARYVSAVEIAPGSAKMTHHVVLYTDTTGASETLDRNDPGPGYRCFGGPGISLAALLGAWVPGNEPRRLPEDIGLSLPAGARVVMQVHYSALAGVREPDRTSLALHLSPGPVRKILRAAPILNETFRIPPGAADHPVTAAIPFVPASVHLLAITPHMHLLGRQMRLWVTRPDGSQACLVDVKDWDFHWQRTYTFATPIAVPVFSRVDLAARYDNSTANPENPSDPPREVGWGENTTDEMCIAILWLTIDAEDLTAGMAASAEVEKAFQMRWPPPLVRDPAAPNPTRRIHGHRH